MVLFIIAVLVLFVGYCRSNGISLAFQEVVSLILGTTVLYIVWVEGSTEYTIWKYVITILIFSATWSTLRKPFIHKPSEEKNEHK